MTESLFFSPLLLPSSPVGPTAGPSNLLSERRPQRRPILPRPQALRFIDTEDGVSQGILIGLLAATLPAVVYALMQTWQLASGDTLSRAVQAFVP